MYSRSWIQNFSAYLIFTQMFQMRYEWSMKCVWIIFNFTFGNSSEFDAKIICLNIISKIKNRHIRRRHWSCHWWLKVDKVLFLSWSIRFSHISGAKHLRNYLWCLIETQRINTNTSFRPSTLLFFFVIRIVNGNKYEILSFIRVSSGINKFKSLY